VNGIHEMHQAEPREAYLSIERSTLSECSN